MAHWRHRAENMTLMLTIGEQIFEERRRQRLSQIALAGMANITRQHLSAIEHGLRPHVSFAVIHRLAGALGMGIDRYGLRKEE